MPTFPQPSDSIVGSTAAVGTAESPSSSTTMMAPIINSSSVRGRAGELEATAAERGGIDNASTLLKQPGPTKINLTAVIFTKIKEE